VPSEESLVRRAQKNDQEAFAQLYEEHFDKIYRYLALRVGNEMEAEDMTQQVFLKALQSISFDHLRKKKKRSSVPLDDSLVASGDSPHAATELKMDIERLLKATKRLTEAQREVISLRFSSELSIAQVAKVMGKSEGAIKALQHSAVVALRRTMLVTEQ